MFSVKQKIYGTKNDQLIIVLGGWGVRQYHLWLLGQLLASYSYKVIIITWDKSILTPNPLLTLERFTQVKEKVIRTIHDVPRKQQRHIALFGISQGTIIAGMVAKEIPTVDRVVLNLSGTNLAETVWSWDSVIPGFKDEVLKQKISLTKLKQIWLPLSPLVNLSSSNVKKALLYLAIHDEIIPYSLQEELLTTLQKSPLLVEGIVNERHNHLKSAVINLLRFPIYIKFLRGKLITEKHQKRK